MAQYAIITSAGINKISDHTTGEFIKIKYYVPVYDDSIPTTAVDILDYVSSASTEPEGTILWKEPTTSSGFYEGISYSPIVDDVDQSRGNFKVTVRPDYNITFNKVALYTEDETLFAQLMIPQTITLETSGASQYGGDVTIDFQLESNLSVDFREIFYSSSEDFWVRIINEHDDKFGILYDGEVHINNQFDSDDVGISKLFVSTKHTINGENPSRERDMPQLCLQFVHQDGRRIRTTFRTTSEGNCELDFYGACNESNYSLIPKQNGLTPGLGLSNRRWNHLYLSDVFEIYNENINVELNEGKYAPIDVNDNSFIKFDLVEQKAIFHNVDIFSNKYFHGNLHNYPDQDLLIESDNGMIIKSGEDVEIRAGNNRNIRVDNNIIPTRTNISFGSIDNSWFSIFVDNIISNRDDNNLFVYNNLIPAGNINLGTSNNRWQQLYVTNIDSISIICGNLVGDNIDVSVRMLITDGDNELTLDAENIWGNNLTIGTIDNPVQNFYVEDIQIV